MARREISCADALSDKFCRALAPLGHTSVDLGINLDSRVGRDPRLGKLNPLVDWDTGMRRQHLTLDPAADRRL